MGWDIKTSGGYVGDQRPDPLRIWLRVLCAKLGRTKISGGGGINERDHRLMKVGVSSAVE
jgi:hypothetical protein